MPSVGYDQWGMRARARAREGNEGVGEGAEGRRRAQLGGEGERKGEGWGDRRTAASEFSCSNWSVLAMNRLNAVMMMI